MSHGEPRPGPRVRRRLSDEVRRAQIIKATVAVVAELGYENASLTLVTLRQGLVDSLVLTDPVPEVIRAAIHRAAGLGVTHHPELAALRQISTNLRAAGGTPRLGLSDYYEETYQGQEALFHRGQKEGSLRDFDARVMAITYQGAVDTMLTYLHEHPEADVHHYADALADLIIAAIRRSPTAA